MCYFEVKITCENLAYPFIRCVFLVKLVSFALLITRVTDHCWLKVFAVRDLRGTRITFELNTRHSNQVESRMSNFTSKAKANSRKKEMALQLELCPEIFLHFSAQQVQGDDDEVYEASTGGPGSIRDIWKKFMAPLTPPLSPPLSPSRQTSGAVSPTCLTATAADTLQCVSDILDLDNCRTYVAERSCSNLASKLIQDCMWGSSTLQEKVQRRKRVEDIYDTPCSTPPSLYVDYVSGECVDPSSVFPYHINSQDFPSGDSSSEDEIDVVTIEKPVKRKSPATCSNVNNNNNTEMKSLREDEPTAKRPRMNLKRSRENSNKEGKETSPDADYEPSTRLSGKEKFEESDCKRNVHNVLERKRRNDLKYSFQVLRDSIPDLKGSERAPKVAILRKATDCILNLRSEQERLLEEKSFLEKRRQSLLHKLKALKESS